jgi:hypothetical protein
MYQSPPLPFRQAVSPSGSRNSLGDDFIAAIHLDWREHGAAVLQEVRSSSPAAYLKNAAAVALGRMGGKARAAGMS